MKADSGLVRVTVMPTAAWPSIDDVSGLGTALSVVAPREFEDANGHVNVCHYYALHLDGGNAAFATLGLDDTYRERTGHSIFSVEHHVTFLDESLVGDELSVHLRLLGVSAKAVHAQTIVVNRTRGAIANTLEFVELHVDLTTRRTTPMDESLISVLRSRVCEHEKLPWSLPLAGAMGVR
jgi:acyl-CoA thioester hydrolase